MQKVLSTFNHAGLHKKSSSQEANPIDLHTEKFTSHETVPLSGDLLSGSDSCAVRFAEIPAPAIGARAPRAPAHHASTLRTGAWQEEKKRVSIILLKEKQGFRFHQQNCQVKKKL